ncbi:serine/threonine-protein phosphatase 6 regulatory ankyrin repeat subunit B-like [Pyrus ussuriensis x Pyrus communis]|uniref:Serine/threonine-protein phosphatase 6 regulatory ankyrin repeat subunit B-like n=1 Tax=Pyrus ussuriensis x Pyrus communis TaxID=2448454 RepID=A0A5N5HH87_9ROSA|nr:serine/threonine-protein phosphatase 6 regulatory ankyrin repeat subunit B-like [Pyrus ussuriensis x Pyrus communis]
MKSYGMRLNIPAGTAKRFEWGVDADATDRALLQSSKPFLYTIVYCWGQNRYKSEPWDVNTGEAFRVGAGLAEAYSVTWCAVEYFEDSGAILHKLLQHHSPNIPHFGRTLIHHAILCNNEKAVEECLKSLASGAADFGLVNSAGFEETDSGADVDLNEQDEKGCLAAMIAAEGGYLETFKLLIDVGADINLQNKRGQTVLDSPVEFYRTQHQAVQHNATDFVLALIGRGSDVNASDADGYTPLMLAAR